MGLGFRGFGFRVQVCRGLGVWDFGFWGFEFCVWGLGVLDFGFRGFGFRVKGLGVLELGVNGSGV